MIHDYEILPLTQEYIDFNRQNGIELELDDSKAVLKCFVKDGDLYSDYTTIIDKDIFNTKDFVLLVHEALNICSQHIKVQKQKRVQ